MDYEIFLVTRVREHVLNGQSDRDAVVQGVLDTSPRHNLSDTCLQYGVAVADPVCAEQQAVVVGVLRPRRLVSPPCVLGPA